MRLQTVAKHQIVNVTTHHGDDIATNFTQTATMPIYLVAMLASAANCTAANMQGVDQPDCRLKTFRSNSEQNAGCNYFPRLQACGVTKEANYKIYRDLN